MRPIASHFRFTLRYSLYAGALLLLANGVSSSVSAKPGSPGQDGSSVKQPLSFQHRMRWFQFGRASWYGDSFQGETTASGEAFDMYQMTCAHRSLPLGALIRITNLRNHRSVVVRVNDRGPMVPSRIVDVSYAAAKLLGFRGMTRVRLDLIDPSPTPEEVARLSWPAQTGR